MTSTYKNTPTTDSTKARATYSTRIRRLRGIAKNISAEDIEKDERLALLINGELRPSQSRASTRL